MAQGYHPLPVPSFGSNKDVALKTLKEGNLTPQELNEFVQKTRNYLLSYQVSPYMYPDAEEGLSDAWCYLLQHPEQLDTYTESEVFRYLKTSIKHAMADAAERDKKLSASNVYVHLHSETFCTTNPEEIMHLIEEENHRENMKKELTSRQAEIWALYESGISVSQIASMLQIDHGAVSRHLTAAKKKLSS